MQNIRIQKSIETRSEGITMIRTELQSFVEKLLAARQERLAYVSRNQRETKAFLENAKRARQLKMKEIGKAASVLQTICEQLTASR